MGVRCSPSLQRESFLLQPRSVRSPPFNAPSSQMPGDLEHGHNRLEINRIVGSAAISGDFIDVP